MKDPSKEESTEIPRNFSEVITMVQQDRNCSRAEALRYIYETTVKPRKESPRYLRNIEKQQSPNDLGEIISSIYNIPQLLLSQGEATKKNQTQNLHNDILLIHLSSKNKAGMDINIWKFIEENLIQDLELAMELIKKGWINPKE